VHNKGGVYDNREAIRYDPRYRCIDRRHDLGNRRNREQPLRFQRQAFDQKKTLSLCLLSTHCGHPLHQPPALLGGWRMRLKRSILIAAGAVVVGLGTLAVMGSVVIFDPHREVVSAQLVDGWGHKQRLSNLVYMRVGVPRLEGAVRITCKSGRVVEGGYVTPGAPTWQKIGEADCRRS
jgi:hypothetical protein